MAMDSFHIAAWLCSALIAGSYSSLSGYELQEREVQIVEDQRPDDVRRMVSGRCGNHTYEVTVAIGTVPKAASILQARVDDRSWANQLGDTLAMLPPNARAITDVFIDRCEAKRARVQIDVLQTGPPPNVHHYYLWFASDGSIEWLGEK